MAKFDEQLQRMAYLMEYKAPQSKGVSTAIEYNTVGADGKVYGIIKEGTKYYIKTTEKGKENICESYAYINGFDYRRENEYSSYNEATKHLEMKLISLNEARGSHKDVSTVDFKRDEKTYASLTEEARRELDRMQQIMENCGCCGCKPVGTGFGTADTKENNKPFGEKADANLDKDSVATKKDPKTVGDTEKPKDAEAQLTSTKAPKSVGDSTKGEKAPKPESDGVALAAEKGGKVNKGVTLKEGCCDEADEDLNDGMFEDGNEPDFTVEDDNENGDLVGQDGIVSENNEVITGEDATMTGKQNGTDGVQTVDVLENGSVKTAPVKPEESENIMTGKQNGTDGVQSVERVNEMAKKATRKIINKVNEGKALENYVTRLVKEEATRLNIWGQHPRYGKEPFSTPENKEVLRGTASKDWNDDSAKRSVRYGQSKGKSNPYDEKVDAITDCVLQMVMESLKKKK